MLAPPCGFNDAAKGPFRFLPAGTTPMAGAFPTGNEMERMMRCQILIAVALASLVTSATAQTNPTVHKDCPPGTGAQAPAVGDVSKRPLSDRLASSKGIICPPAGVDPAMQQRPQEGGTLKVVPPPGSPGGDQSVQPK